MKVSKEEIKKVEEYQKLKKHLEKLREDLNHATYRSICYSDGWGREDFNFDYSKVIKRIIKFKIRSVKKRIKEMEA